MCGLLYSRQATNIHNSRSLVLCFQGLSAVPRISVCMQSEDWAQEPLLYVVLAHPPQTHGTNAQSQHTASTNGARPLSAAP